MYSRLQMHFESLVVTSHLLQEKFAPLSALFVQCYVRAFMDKRRKTQRKMYMLCIIHRRTYICYLNMSRVLSCMLNAAHVDYLQHSLLYRFLFVLVFFACLWMFVHSIIRREQLKEQTLLQEGKVIARDVIWCWHTEFRSNGRPVGALVSGAPVSGAPTSRKYWNDLHPVFKYAISSSGVSSGVQNIWYKRQAKYAFSLCMSSFDGYSWSLWKKEVTSLKTLIPCGIRPSTLCINFMSSAVLG